MFKQTGTEENYLIGNIKVLPGDYRANPFIYEKDGFRIKAETTIVYMDFIANASNNPNSAAILDSSIGQFWVPPHFEAYDTVIAYKLRVLRLKNYGLSYTQDIHYLLKFYLMFGL